MLNRKALAFAAAVPLFTGLIGLTDRPWPSSSVAVRASTESEPFVPPEFESEGRERRIVATLNSIEAVQLLFALFKAGLIAVTVNIRLKPAEIRFILDNANVRLCFSEPALAPTAGQASAACPIFTQLPSLETERVHSSMLPPVHTDQRAVILYTSGLILQLASSPLIQGGSRMSRGARTDLCGGISDGPRYRVQVVEVKRTVPVERFGAFCQTERMSPAPVKPLIEPTLLEQLDVRVGTIEAVGAVPGSDKLVQLRVQFGDHLRIIVAGMKQERTDPREIEGKQALFVINLPPKKLRGVVSEGMLFDIGYADGITPVLAMPETHVPDGTRAG